MDFIRRVQIEIERLKVVEEFVKNGAIVIEFPGDGFFGFFMNATTSYGLSSAHLENKKRDVGLYLYGKRAKLGDRVAIKATRLPPAGKPGIVVGILDSVHFLSHGKHEHIPCFNIVPDGTPKRVRVDFSTIPDTVSVAFEDIVEFLVEN